MNKQLDTFVEKSIQITLQFLAEKDQIIKDLEKKLADLQTEALAKKDALIQELKQKLANCTCQKDCSCLETSQEKAEEDDE